MNTLDDIVGDIQQDDSTTVEVDITRFCKSGNKTVLLWRNPDIRKIYMIAPTATELLKANLTWQSDMAIDVATLAACHVGPVSVEVAPGPFYGALTRNPQLWVYLLNQMNQNFPHLKGVNQNEFLKDVFKLCIRYLKKRPEECGDIPSETLEKLREMDREDAARGLMASYQ